MKEVKKIFYKAISNDIYFDVIVNQKLKTKEIFGFEFFKPSKAIQLFKKFPFLIISMKALQFLWLPIGLFILIFSFARALFKFKIRRISIRNETVFLLFSGKLQLLKENIRNVESEHTLIYLNKKLLKSSSDDRIISIFDMANLKDYLKSFYLSVIVHFEMCIKHEFRGYKKLFSLFSYDWFLVYNTLIRQDFTKVYFSNHYDRWAILFDVLRHNETSLIQHGLLSEEVSPPYKLNNISEVFCFDINQFNLFRKIIVSNNPTFKVISNKINLVDLNVKSTTILIVSCLPLTFTYDKLLLEHLSKKKYEIYLKPHPVYPINPYSDLQKSINFNLISEKDFFPKVDLVVSYNSTLGYEYEMCGIKVYYVNNDSDLESIIDLL